MRPSVPRAAFSHCASLGSADVPTVAQQLLKTRRRARRLLQRRLQPSAIRERIRPRDHRRRDDSPGHEAPERQPGAPFRRRMLQTARPSLRTGRCRTRGDQRSPAASRLANARCRRRADPWRDRCPSRTGRPESRRIRAASSSGRNHASGRKPSIWPPEGTEYWTGAAPADRLRTRLNQHSRDDRHERASTAQPIHAARSRLIRRRRRQLSSMRASLPHACVQPCSQARA